VIIQSAAVEDWSFWLVFGARRRCSW